MLKWFVQMLLNAELQAQKSLSLCKYFEGKLKPRPPFGFPFDQSGLHFHTQQDGESRNRIGVRRDQR